MDSQVTLPRSPPPTFLTLPPEIRENIYSILLRSANNRYDPPLEEDYEYDLDDPTSGPRYHFDFNILYVNKLVYEEAKKVFQDNIFVKITTPSADAISIVNSKGEVAVVALEDHATDFQHFHLRVMISSPEDFSHFKDSYSMITCLDDLPAFTRIWHFSNLSSGRQLNPHLSLRLDLKNPYHAGTTVPKSLQEKLLLPFSRVKDLASMSFDYHGSPFFADCAAYPSIQKAVLNEQSVPVPTPEECLEACVVHKTKGHDLITKKDYKGALEEFFKAMAEIHVFVEGRKRSIHCEQYYNTYLTVGLFKDSHGGLIRMLLRVQLVSAVMQAYLGLNDNEEAYFWGQRSLRLLRQSMTSMTGIDTLGGEGWEQFVAHSYQRNWAGRQDVGWIYYRTLAAKVAIARTRVTGKADKREIDALTHAAEVYASGDELLKAELAAMSIRAIVREEGAGSARGM